MSRKANFKIVARNGPACPRCGAPTQVREHKRVGQRELSKLFYFSKWFFCANPHCVTNTILPPAYRVYPQRDHDGDDHDDHPVGAPDWSAFEKARRRQRR